jgi:hypothetical protein
MKTDFVDGWKLWSREKKINYYFSSMIVSTDKRVTRMIHEICDEQTTKSFKNNNNLIIDLNDKFKTSSIDCQFSYLTNFGENYYTISGNNDKNSE